MEWWLTLVMILSVLIVLVLIGVPVGVSIGLSSFIFLVGISGFDLALSIIYTEFFDFWTSWVILPIPLFVFMGEFLFAGGHAENIFDMAAKWLRRLPGGLAVATTGACALFGTMTGSSLGATATFSLLAVPEMLKKGYSPRLCTGAVCAAGGLAHLIPPSILAVVYCSLLDLSIGQMFMAGVVPGILLALGYAIIAMVWAVVRPSAAPIEDPVSWKERFFVLRKVWGPIVIVLAVLGTIYFGVATVTEAAAMGAAAALFMSIASKRLTWKLFVHTILETVKVSTFIVFIAVAGKMLSWVLTYYQIPQNIVNILLKAELNRYTIIIVMMLVYLGMGMFIDAIGMIVVTMPILFPILLALDFSPIWFGVLLFINIEMALVTPPLGFNIYIVRGNSPQIPLKDIFLGAFTFCIADISMIGLVMIFPQLALWLPDAMFH